MSRTRPWLFIAAAILPALFLMQGAMADQPLVVQPGENLQAMVDAAPSGSTILLVTGVHRGPLKLSQSLTLRGQDGTHLMGTGTGSVMVVAGDNINVENLEISHSGRDFAIDDAGVQVLGRNARIQGLLLHDNLHGIYVRRAVGAQVLDNEVIGLAATQTDLPPEAVHDDHMSDGMHHNPPSAQSLMGNGIHLFNARKAVVANNLIHHVRDGIYVAHTSGAVFRGNRIHNSRYGIHYMYSSDNIIEGNELWRNVAGPALMFSRNLTVSNNILRNHRGFRAYGLLLQNIDSSRFADNLIIGNRVGMRLRDCSNNQMIDNRIASNLSGLTIDSSSIDNLFTRNVFGFNLHQVELTGPTPPTEWSANGVGNRWHGAMPLDLNGDGISEWPHHEVDLIGARREQFPAVQLLIGSPGIRAMEWALKRAPVPKMRFLTDPHPLTREVPP